MGSAERLGPGQSRSSGAIARRRIPQDWPSARRFRILSIDGGGIRGIFPATVLAELEKRFTGGQSVAGYFDLIAGTSTGGILALGLGAGHTGAQLRDLYVTHGGEVFPPLPEGAIGRLKGWWRNATQLACYRYDSAGLTALLTQTLGERRYGDSKVRLCIPAFDGRHGEVFVFKTPHHPDYKTDRFVKMVDVGLSTAAAPAFYRPHQQGGYTLIDGGVWANNPVMLAVIEALTCFTVAPTQIDVLSLGCGDDPYVVSKSQLRWGGLFAWRDIVFASMRLQSLAATNQARLLLGPPSVLRLDAPTNDQKIALDDWRRSVDALVPAAVSAIGQEGGKIADKFLHSPAQPYVPVPPSGGPS